MTMRDMYSLVYITEILTFYFIYTTSFTLISFYSVNILGSQICALPLNVPIFM